MFYINVVIFSPCEKYVLLILRLWFIMDVNVFSALFMCLADIGEYLKSTASLLGDEYIVDF